MRNFCASSSCLQKPKASPTVQKYKAVVQQLESANPMLARRLNRSGECRKFVCQRADTLHDAMVKSVQLAKRRAIRARSSPVFLAHAATLAKLVVFLTDAMYGEHDERSLEARFIAANLLLMINVDGADLKWAQDALQHIMQARDDGTQNAWLKKKEEKEQARMALLLGTAYSLSGDVESGLVHVRRGLKLYADLEDAIQASVDRRNMFYFAVALICCGEERSEDALEVIESALKLAPPPPTADPAIASANLGLSQARRFLQGLQRGEDPSSALSAPREMEGEYAPMEEQALQVNLQRRRLLAAGHCLPFRLEILCQRRHFE